MQKRRVTQDPVSCESCRTKKLKCNRVQPCANCVARGIACSFIIPPQKRRVGQAPTLHDSAEVLSRIERLEALVRPSSANDDGHFPIRPALLPNPGNDVLSELNQTTDEDLQLLESVGPRDDSLRRSSTAHLAFTITSTQELLQTHRKLQHSNWGSQSKTLSGSAIGLPSYRAATLLFDSYEANVDHVCRILHNPTIRSLTKTFYLRLNQFGSVQQNQAALLLSIFALSAFFYQPFAASEVVSTERDAVKLSEYWSKAAMDVLDYSLRETSGTLEDIQTCILLSYVTYHLNGFSARGRLLWARAAAIARELRLHRLDANDGKSAESEAGLRGMIDREVKRRVFWHIAMTDWLHSVISGPQEGIYSIHPNHIDIGLPKDCNDDEIVLGSENEPIVGGPQPTGMTFFLTKVKLAHLCREWTDTVPLNTSRLMRIPYEHILALDQKSKNFLFNLPFFFKVDDESRRRSKPLETVYPKISIMRYCITAAAHSRRCRLHQKFLLRLSSDARYAYSRQACLESARAVIKVFHDRRDDADPPSIAKARMGMAVHYTHLALVVMVMDLCCNGGEADIDERKEEVNNALQMLEQARDVSPLLGGSLDSLWEVLRKHGISLSSPARSTTLNVTVPVQFDKYHDPIFDIHTQPLHSDVNEHDPLAGGDTSFDDFWATATQNDMHLDSIPWDDLFSALDSRPF